MRMPRIKYANAIYHIYNQGVNRSDIFMDSEDNNFWLTLLQSTIKKYNTNVFCFVTMQNHYHCLLQTSEPNISDVMWYIGYFYVLFINKKYNRVGPLCRNRFQSQLVEDSNYFRNIVCYIHNNPMEAGLISDVYEYRRDILTSFHHLAGRNNNYYWLAKKQLFEYLDTSPSTKDFKHLLWKPISEDLFKEMTKIELSNQKINKQRI
jgi:REP element-mobilizing transposase RayT